ncbi:MAG: hypothetical protein ABIZ52_03630 [Candidatus Limnocylindrales bacterium]
MSEDRRRRRSRGGAVGRVGEPNVLSDAARPNELSGTVTRPANIQVGAREGSESWLSTGATAPKPRIRLPSFGTLIFFGFLALTGFRLLNEFVDGLADQTPAPTTPAGPTESARPGPITFGTDTDDDCAVLQVGVEFQEGTDIWWSAELATVQAPDASVVIIVRRDGTQVDREDVPPDASFGKWSVLCSGAPVVESGPGVYRVEVWDQSVTTLHAAGGYRLTPG